MTRELKIHNLNLKSIIFFATGNNIMNNEILFQGN